MLNFTLGPVQSSDIVRQIGSQNVPYFRTQEFSSIMLENERLLKALTKAEEAARAIFLTGSGTAAMEAVVMNVFTTRDKVLVINGGSFGQRFSQLCGIHDVAYTEIKLPAGKNLTPEMLETYGQQGYTGLLVNIHESSTCVYYNPEIIADFCKRNHIFWVVDAISSFLADPFDMERLGVDVMITGSQKALACPPGISAIVLSRRAIERIEENHVKSMYFDLKSALKNGERGQTPFTPAVGILLQLHAVLTEINKNGGIETEQKRIAALAQDFRSRIKTLPFDIFSESLSNAATPLATRNCSAYDVFTTLKDEYGIWICPNGGELRDKIFRVGHMGELGIEDNTQLIHALRDMEKRGML